MISGVLAIKATDPLGGLIALSLFIAAGLLIISKTTVKTRLIYYMTVWILSALFVPLGLLRAYEVTEASELKSYLEKSSEATVTGTIEFISNGDDSYNLTLSKTLTQIGQKSYSSNKILVSLDYSYEFMPACGMQITAKGKLYPMQKATNPGQFDSELYYSLKFIDARLYAEEVPLVNKDTRVFTDRLYQIRLKLSEALYSIFPPDKAGVLISMLTGDRGLLDKNLKELYSLGGIAHILAISSLHITLLGMGLFRILMRFVRILRLNIIITLTVMWSYVILTGSSASALRAVIMLTVILVGRFLGRGSDMLNSIALSALIILIRQPLYIYDSGFWLSYTAVLGITAAGALTAAYKIKNAAVSAIIMSLSVQIFTFPVLLGTYYGFNPYTVLVNLIVLPLVSVVLVCGALAAVIAMLPFAKLIAVFVAGPTYYVLHLYERICEAELKFPYHQVLTGAPCGVNVALYYAVTALTLFMLLRGQKHDRKQLFKVCMLIFCLVIFLKKEQPDVVVSFIDVGQGDAILVELREEDGIRRILMDSGSTSVSSVGTYRVIPFLKYKGITELDAVVISHTDADHISAIMEMLEEGYPKVSELITGVHESESEDVIKLAKQKGVPVRRVAAGDRIGDYVAVIAPEKENRYFDKNAASVVLYAEYNSFSMLLTGDSDFESEEHYLRRLNEVRTTESVSVLKVAHHGSKNSSALETLLEINPVCSVISCAKYNLYKHPSYLTLERLETVGTEIYKTLESGMIEVTYNDGEVMSITP